MIEATSEAFYFHRLKPVSTILKTCLSNTGITGPATAKPYHFLHVLRERRFIYFRLNGKDSLQELGSWNFQMKLFSIFID